MNIESRRECKDLMTILEKVSFVFITCVDQFSYLFLLESPMLIQRW